MYKLIPILFFLGCASKHSVEFNPTNSMCLDSTIANMHSAGCKAVAVEKTVYGLSKVYCHKYSGKPTTSSWINNEFYSIAFGTKIPDDVIPICTDPFLIMTVAEKD